MIRAILEAGVSECIEQVRCGYLLHDGQSTSCPPSVFVHPKPGARIIALPASFGEGRPSGIKWIASYPENILHGKARASAVIVLNSPENGYPIACLEGSLISAARTAASAVLAVSALREGRRIEALGIVGTGLIARTVYDFLRRSGWQIDSVFLYDRLEGEAQRFARRIRIAEPQPRLEIVHSARDAICNSDTVVFATTATEPHVDAPEWFAHRPLVIHLSLRDLGSSVIRSATNVTDHPSHVLTAGTSLHLASMRYPDESLIHATLVEFFRGRVELNRDRAIVFSPFGLGTLDLAVAHWVYEQIRERGLGVLIPDFFDGTSNR